MLVMFTWDLMFVDIPARGGEAPGAGGGGHLGFSTERVQGTPKQARKPRAHARRKYLALVVAGIYSIVGVMALIASVRAIVGNAVTYRLFANL